jgi:hypothetical protein
VAQYQPRRLPEIVVDDPDKVAWIDSQMERAKPKQGRRKRRPTGGRVIHMWVNSEQQARLQAIADKKNVSLNVAAKRVLEDALQGG